MSPLKVYYLDDEPDLLELFTDTFSSARIAVKTFHDPRAFVQAVEAERPDVVFLDFRLPQTNGDLVAQAIDSKIRKVLVTGDVSVRSVTQFEQVFEKPYSIRVIADYLQSLLDAQTGGTK